jgi:hypothetical protein
MSFYSVLVLSGLVVALSAMVPLVSLVQSVGKQRQLERLGSLNQYGISKSQHYMIAYNYFKALDPFAIGKSYALPVTILSLVTATCAAITYFGAQWTSYLETYNYILGGTFGLSSNDVKAYQSGTVATGSAAFIGAYIYMIRILLSRINNDDIAPITYYYFAVRILIACLVAGIVRHALFVLAPAESQIELKLLIPIGFVVGLQPDLWTVALITKISKRFGLFGRQPDPADSNVPTNLSLLLIQGLTESKRDRLEELDIDNCQALAAANPFVIWARTAYQLLQIADWIAQAQLISVVHEEGMRRLRGIGIRDIFAFEAALKGSGKASVASSLGVDGTLAEDILAYLTAQPSFRRLLDVYKCL